MVNSLLDDLRPEIRGLDTVRISKDDLLKALEENKAEHRQIFEEAIDKWHEQVKVKLAKMIEQAKLGPDQVELMVGLPRPDDHTKDYTAVIRLVTMSQRVRTDLPRLPAVRDGRMGLASRLSEQHSELQRGGTRQVQPHE